MNYASSALFGLSLFARELFGFHQFGFSLRVEFHRQNKGSIQVSGFSAVTRRVERCGVIVDPTAELQNVMVRQLFDLAGQYFF